MNTLFEHTLYINLEHRKDRLEHVQQELEKIGTDAEVIDLRTIRPLDKQTIINRL